MRIINTGLFLGMIVGFSLAHIISIFVFNAPLSILVTQIFSESTVIGICYFGSTKLEEK